MVNRNTVGNWSHDYREFIEGIRDSDDQAYVLTHLAHTDAPVRLAVAQWFGFGEGYWAGRGIDTSTMDSRLRHPPMPDDVAAVLLNDPAPTVASCAALRVDDVALLVDVILEPETHSWVLGPATSRVLNLGRLDDLLAAASPQRLLPFETCRELARHCDRADVLDALLTVEALRDALLANPALTHEQLTTLIGIEPPGRPDVDPRMWGQILAAAARSFAESADWPNPGGFEAAELRECGPAAGRLLAAAAPLCAAAAVVVEQEAEAPDWAHEAVTWALELSRFDTDPKSLYPRLCLSPQRVTAADIPEVAAEELRDAADTARHRGRSDPDWAPLADGAARLLDAMAVGEGSLHWLRRFGGGNGYDVLHAFAILALSASAPLRVALRRP